MARIITTPATFPAAIRRKLRDRQRQLEMLSVGTAHRGLAHAVKLTNDEGLVDLGTYKRGFQVRHVRGVGGELVNTAPYAGIIEHGRRPGAPGPPLEPIYQWVRRKLGIDDRNVAWVIRNAIHRRGLRPRFIMRRTFRQMQGWFREEALKLLSR